MPAPQLFDRRAGILAIEAKLRRPADGLRVATDLAARRGEFFAGSLGVLQALPSPVPDVRVACRELDHHGTRRSDPDRRMWTLHGLRTCHCIPQAVVAAVECRSFLCPQQLDQLKALGETANLVIRATDVEHLILECRPSRADPELKAAVRQVIHGYRLFCEQRRMAVDHPSHQQADPDLGGRLRHRREQRPPLIEGRISPIRARGGEMIERPAMVEPGVVRDVPNLPERLDRRTTGELESYAQAVLGRGHCVASIGSAANARLMPTPLYASVTQH